MQSLIGLFTTSTMTQSLIGPITRRRFQANRCGRPEVQSDPCNEAAFNPRDQKGFNARRLPVSTSTSLFTVRPFDRSLLTVWIKDGPLFEGH